MLIHGRIRRSLLALLAIAALPASAQILNSERIEQAFGSYGIAVVHSDERIRVSDLYSTDGAARITRTLAIVAYPVSIEPAIARAHARILAGESIGATFQNEGWQVVKTGHCYFETSLPAAVAAVMNVAPGTRSAVHAYRLHVASDAASYDYAEIIEMHHPDYLTIADLEEIYGPAEQVSVPAPTRRLLTEGLEYLDSSESTLSEQGAQVDDG